MTTTGGVEVPAVWDQDRQMLQDRNPTRTSPSVSPSAPRHRWAHLLSVLGAVLSAVAVTVVAPGAGSSTASATGGCTAVAYNSSQDPIRIAEPGHLVWLSATSADWDKDFLQVGDISLAGCVMNTIGDGTNAFTGTYDGGGKTISNLSLTGIGNIGLFGFTDGATIAHLSLANVTVAATGTAVGALVGVLERSTVDDITISAASVSTSTSIVGGLFGAATDATISAVTLSNVSVSATQDSSGSIGGGVSHVSISDVTVTQGLVESFSYAGGLIGSSYFVADSQDLSIDIAHVTISDVRVVAGGEYAGGLLGSLDITALADTFPQTGGAASANIANVSMERVDVSSGRSLVGGLIGSAYVSADDLSVASVDISRVAVVDGTMEAASGQVGGLIGYLGGQHSDIHISDVIMLNARVESTEGLAVGGLLGEVSMTYRYAPSVIDIQHAYVEGSVSSSDPIDSGNEARVGGAIGHFAASGTELTIAASGVDATVSASIAMPDPADDAELRVGGLIGHLDHLDTGTQVGNAVLLRDVVARGEVSASTSATAWVGGLIGQANAELADTRVMLENAYAAGSIVTVGATPGFRSGLVGEVDGSGLGSVTASASSWDVEASGVAVDALLPSTAGRTTIDMQQLATFVGDGWSIVDGSADPSAIWGICDGATYPFLMWSVQPLGISCDDGSGGSTDTVMPPPPGVPGMPMPERLGGSTRVDTAVMVSQEFFSSGAPVVYLATARDFADALVAGAAAGFAGGPVLLTERDALPVATLLEVRRLDPDRIVVVGGTSVISSSVFAAVAGEAPTVVRIGGDDRYATAALLSRDTATAQASVVFVATGETYADAIAGGPAAGLDGAPVLLVQRDAIPAVTATELQRLDPDWIVVLGLTSAVSSAVEAQLAAFAPVVERIGGVTRYETSVALSASKYLPGVQVAFLATGTGFADALSAVPAATVTGGPVLLSRPSCVPPSVLAELERVRPARIVVLGGQSALTASVSSLVVCST